MPDMTLSCSCCGKLLTLPEEAALCLCPACGTANARPRSTGSHLEMLQRAVKQRIARDYHEAENSYQQVLLHIPEEHEALWGRLLCRYGVEYVEDPATRRMLPTVHSVQPRPLQAQADFTEACGNAPAEVADQYRRDAAYIDAAQAEIRRLAAAGQPWDVFICHKTTRIGSTEKTEDFHRAYQLYHYLKAQNLRVFFAPECLSSVAGANYEAGIYNALTTAKVMLVVCSDAAHVNSPWVRSEWVRFLDLTEETAADEKGAKKRLIPLLYDHFDPDQIPQFRFRSLQGVDMSQLTASQTVLSLVREVIPSSYQKLEDMAAGLAEGAARLGKGARAAYEKVSQWRPDEEQKETIRAGVRKVEDAVGNVRQGMQSWLQRLIDFFRGLLDAFRRRRPGPGEDAAQVNDGAADAAPENVFEKAPETSIASWSDDVFKRVPDTTFAPVRDDAFEKVPDGALGSIQHADIRDVPDTAFERIPDAFADSAPVHSDSRNA